MNEPRSDEFDDELGDTIRNGLRETTSGVGRSTVGDLASSLTQRRSGHQRHSRRFRFTAIAAAAALIAVIAGAGVWLANDDDGDDVDVVADQPTTTTPEPGPFDDYEPGWHEIDPGPVPAMNSASVAWTGEQIIVAGGLAWNDGPESGAFAYDPASREWRQLPDPPVADPTVVATSHGLVAVGISEESAGGFSTDWVWATLAMAPTGSDQDPSDEPQRDDSDTAASGWELHGAVETAPELAGRGLTGPDDPSGRPTVLWTGERVIDVTHGTVLDPVRGESTALPMPSSVVNYTYLISSNAVWTGDEVVLVAWSEGDGLAWDATGESFRIVPGLPVDMGSDPSAGISSTAVGNDGEVALMEWTSADAAGGRTAVLDVTEGKWTTPPDRPTSPDRFSCPLAAAFVGADLVVASCTGTDADPGAPVRLEGDRWVEIGTPGWNASCCIGAWLGIDDALVVWSTDTDTTNNPQAPYVRGAIWIPGSEREPIESTDPTTTSTPDTPGTGTGSGPEVNDPRCRLQVLPDLAPFLPAGFDPTPQKGIGGMPDSADLCARFWGTPESPGIHITQSPGPTSWPIYAPTASGRYQWGEIHEGVGVVFTGEPTWSLQAYGISDEEFAVLVDGLVSSDDRTLPIRIERPRPDTRHVRSPIMSIDSVATSPGTDLFIIGFEGETPTLVQASYAESPVADQCVPPENLEGATYLNVRLSYATLGPSLRPQGGESVTIRVPEGGPVLSGMVTCDFEGNVYIAFGLNGPRPVTASIDESNNELKITVG